MLVEKNFVLGNGWKKVSFGTIKNIRIILKCEFWDFFYFLFHELFSTIGNSQLGNINQLGNIIIYLEA